MEVFFAIIFVYYGFGFLMFIIEFVVESIVMLRGNYMSKKHREIIRRWEWLNGIGCHETAKIIVKSIK